MYYSSHDCHNGSGLNMMGQQNYDTGQGYNAVPAQRVGNEHGSDGNGQLGILATKRGHIKVPQYLAQYPELGTLGKDDYSEDMSHTQEIFRNVIEEQCYKIQEFNTHSLWVQNQVTNEFQQRHCQQLHEVKQSLHDLDRKKIHEYKQSDLNLFLDTPIKFQEIENEGELHWRNVIKTNERDWNRFLDGCNHLWHSLLNLGYHIWLQKFDDYEEWQTSASEKRYREINWETMVMERQLQWQNMLTNNDQSWRNGMNESLKGHREVFDTCSRQKETVIAVMNNFCQTFMNRHIDYHLGRNQLRGNASPKEHTNNVANTHQCHARSTNPHSNHKPSSRKAVSLKRSSGQGDEMAKVIASSKPKPMIKQDTTCLVSLKISKGKSEEMSQNASSTRVPLIGQDTTYPNSPSSVLESEVSLKNSAGQGCKMTKSVASTTLEPMVDRDTHRLKSPVNIPENNESLKESKVEGDEMTKSIASSKPNTMILQDETCSRNRIDVQETIESMNKSDDQGNVMTNSMASSEPDSMIIQKAKENKKYSDTVHKQNASKSVSPSECNDTVPAFMKEMLLEQLNLDRAALQEQLNLDRAANTAVIKEMAKYFEKIDSNMNRVLQQRDCVLQQKEIINVHDQLVTNNKDKSLVPHNVISERETKVFDQNLHQSYDTPIQSIQIELDTSSTGYHGDVSTDIIRGPDVSVSQPDILETDKDEVISQTDSHVSYPQNTDVGGVSEIFDDIPDNTHNIHKNLDDSNKMPQNRNANQFDFTNPSEICIASQTCDIDLRPKTPYLQSKQFAPGANPKYSGIAGNYDPVYGYYGTGFDYRGYNAQEAKYRHILQASNETYKNFRRRKIPVRHSYGKVSPQVPNHYPGRKPWHPGDDNNRRFKSSGTLSCTQAHENIISEFANPVMSNRQPQNCSKLADVCFNKKLESARDSKGPTHCETEISLVKPLESKLQSPCSDDTTINEGSTDSISDIMDSLGTKITTANIPVVHILHNMREMNEGITKRPHLGTSGQFQITKVENPYSQNSDAVDMPHVSSHVKGKGSGVRYDSQPFTPSSRIL